MMRRQRSQSRTSDTNGSRRRLARRRSTPARAIINPAPSSTPPNVTALVAHWLLGDVADVEILTRAPRFQRAVATVARELDRRDVLSEAELAAAILSGLAGQPVLVVGQPTKAAA